MVLYVNGDRFLVNMRAYVLHPPAAVLQLNQSPQFITQIRTQSVQKGDNKHPVLLLT